MGCTSDSGGRREILLVHTQPTSNTVPPICYRKYCSSLLNYREIRFEWERMSWTFGELHKTPSITTYNNK